VTMRKIPGLTSYDIITLERGLSRDNDLERWREQIVQAGKNGRLGPDGKPVGDFRRNVTIQLHTKDGVLARQWNLFAAWPSALEIGDLDASASDVLIQTLELAHEGFGLVRGADAAASIGGESTGAAGGLGS